MFTQIAEKPWAIVPRSKQGNNTLLVFTNKFTKWIELIPMRAANTASEQNAFRERILSRFGVPKVFTDNGSLFTSHSVKRCFQLLGIKQQHTAPYTPQENPTERSNRTIKTPIAQLTEGEHLQLQS